jgi:hypothetical protein
MKRMDLFLGNQYLTHLYHFVRGIVEKIFPIVVNLVEEIVPIDKHQNKPFLPMMY